MLYHPILNYNSAYSNYSSTHTKKENPANKCGTPSLSDAILPKVDHSQVFFAMYSQPLQKSAQNRIPLGQINSQKDLPIKVFPF